MRTLVSVLIVSLIISVSFKKSIVLGNEACLGGSDINSVGAKIQVFTDSFWPLDTGFGQQHGLEGTKPTPPMAALTQA